MEQPASSHADRIRDEKVKVLRAIAPIELSDCVLGQYTASKTADPSNTDASMGYRDDPGVPDDSVTPTFAATSWFFSSDLASSGRMKQWEHAPAPQSTYTPVQFHLLVSPWHSSPSEQLPLGGCAVHYESGQGAKRAEGRSSDPVQGCTHRLPVPGKFPHQE